jgi:DNA-binding SARP family transcriptional activator
MTDTGPAETNSGFRLVTLGSASLLAAGAGASDKVLLRPGKPLALLIYLASSPEKTASREHLINLLWADADPERGLRTLRQTIFQIRQLLGEDAITSSGRDLCLALKLAFDRDDFLRAVSRGDAESAIAIYKGAFLPDFGVPGGAEFEHWTDRERDRLQSAYVRSAESVVRLRLDRGQYDAAIAEAKRLRDSDPSRESSWRLLLESLTSSGDRNAAVAEAEELERYLASEDRDPEKLTRSAISRAKKVQSPAISNEPAVPKLVAELIGRDREFSRLTSTWAVVKSGHFRHIHISAPPGFGKSRLLRDVFTRLRASGARATWVNALAGDRKLAYGLASDIVGKLGQLSGASGISTAAASSLIALNPKLSSSFSAAPDRADGEEALRHRVHAVTELFEAVADEAPIALFVDDMHWSDPVSRQLLKSAFSRIGDCRIFLVTSGRTVPDGSLNLANTDVISLEPLDRDEVKQIISSFACLPDISFSDELIDTMHEHTGGSPLLILENLHLAIERGLLEMKDGNWSFGNRTSLIDAVSRGDVLEERIRKLDEAHYRLILLLSIAEEPVPVPVIASALARDQNDIESSLATLEQHALAVSSAGEWMISHDSIAETVVQMAYPQERAEAHHLLGTARLHSSYLPHLRLAIRHLNAAGDRDKIREAFVRAVAIARAAGDQRSTLQLAAAMLGESLPSKTATRLAESLPLRNKISTAAIVGVAFAAIVLSAIGVIAFRMMPSKPTQLAITAQPLAANMLVVPPPVVEIQDSKGRRVQHAGDTVTVETVEAKPGITGTLSVPVVDGRAVFNDVSVTGVGAFQLRFKSKQLKPALSHRINVTGVNPTLRLISGAVNGQRIDARHRAVRVSRGDKISGDLLLQYSSYWGSASVILGATATWGDRTKNFLDLAPLFTPAENQPRRAHIEFTAPETDGIYHIVVAFDAEGNVEDFMSGTNWRLPKPIWNDGNDIADWSAEQFAQANSQGWAMSKFVQIDNATGKPRTDPHPVAATVIDVVVK